MKILFIISSLNAGGAERVLTTLANSLCNNHDITIATFSIEDSFYSLDQRINHIKLDLLKPSTSRFESVKNNFNRFSVLKKSIKEIDADVNISFMTQTNILSILACKVLGKKIIVSERTIYSAHISKIVYLLRRIVYPLSNYLITQTVADSKHYHFVKDLRIIYNPLVINRMKSNKENIVLAVGRLNKLKGFDLLIESFEEVESDDWKLVIAGDGIEKEPLLQLINKLNIKNIELIGKRKEIFEWYAKSSIFVLSSKKEGFPNVLLEAMGSGCAVVSFDCPYGPSEIIENRKNGLLVENQNKKKLTNAIQELIDNQILRNNLSKEASTVKDKYSVEQIVKQWEEVMEKVISS